MSNAKYKIEHNHVAELCYEDLPTELIKDDNREVFKLYLTF